MLSAPRYIMLITVSSCQNFDELQFRTLHNFVSSRKLDLFVRALLLEHILALKKLRVHLACILFILYLFECLFYFSSWAATMLIKNILIHISILFTRTAYCNISYQQIVLQPSSKIRMLFVQ